MTDLEICKRKQLQEDLWVGAQAHESLLRQKSRSRWLKEGDCNTRYFHIRMNANTKRNCIKGLLIKGILIDEPNMVKEEIRTLFSKRFQEADSHRPKIDGINFKTIDQQQNAMLVAPFQEIEIQNAVWEYGNDNSPGPDGINFRFIKQFWDTLLWCLHMRIREVEQGLESWTCAQGKQRGKENNNSQKIIVKVK